MVKEEIKFKDMTFAQKRELKEILENMGKSVFDILLELRDKFPQNGELKDSKIKKQSLIEFSVESCKIISHLPINYQIKSILYGVDGYEEEEDLNHLSESKILSLCLESTLRAFSGNILDKKK